jgi:hypothetical protein
MIAWLNKQLTAAQLGGGARFGGAVPMPPTPAACKGAPPGGAYAGGAKAWVLPAQYLGGAAGVELAAGSADRRWSQVPNKAGCAPDSSPAAAAATAARHAPQLPTPTK